MIIAFSGTDGAGKSTQIQALTSHVISQGGRPHAIWARGGYTPLMLSVKNLVLRLLGRHGDSHGFDQARSAVYTRKRKGLMQRPLVARSWLALAIIDLMLYFGVYARWLSLRGHTVIADRYVGDTRIDFMRNFPAHFKPHGFLWRLLCLVAPRPDLHVLLTVDVEVSRQRSREKGEPFPDDVETLAFRLKAYRSMPEFARGRVLALDGTDSIQQVQQQITDAMDQLQAAGSAS